MLAKRSVLSSMTSVNLIEFGMLDYFSNSKRLVSQEILAWFKIENRELSRLVLCLTGILYTTEFLKAQF